MSLHCFDIRALDPGADQDVFNAFCTAHRVLNIERQLVHDGAQSYWAVCVEVADGPGPLPPALKRGGRGAIDRAGQAESATPANAPPADRPDYRQLLSPTDFVVFAALRQWRKGQAQADGVPLFAVLTNEQMAEVARQRCATLAALGAVDGIGPARLDRYGAAILQCVARAAEVAQAAVPNPTASPPP